MLAVLLTDLCSGVQASYNYVPDWNPYMPRGASPLKQPAPPVRTPDGDRSRIPRKVRNDSQHSWSHEWFVSLAEVV